MSREKIIIVEDSKFQGIIMRDILRKNGFDVTWVISAEKAMEFNIYTDFDLVLLDVVLPGLNGYEFCEIIKKNNSLMPVIVLTSMEDEKSVVKALNSGADDYIKKPYNIDELMARIKVQLRTRKLQMELINKNEELQRANQTIKELAITDMLTGAYNRSYIKEYLDKILNESIGDIFDLSCAMIDIDNFKTVNDTYGHLTGDIILENLSKICKLNIGESGIVIRFGGEEFLIIARDNINNIFDICEAIRSDCENSMCCGFKYTVSIGIGVSKIQKNTAIKDFQECIKVADRLLYVSKNRGKNRVTKNEEVHTA